MKDSLFGKYCYIDTPWIAGKKTVYRILASGVVSNTYCNVPVNAKTKPEWHRDFEPIVYVVLDTLAGEDSEILRFALKDVEIIDDESKEIKHGEWVNPEMDKYVRAEAAKGAIRKVCFGLVLDEETEKVIKDELDELPSIDICYCKDCKHYKSYYEKYKSFFGAYITEEEKHKGECNYIGKKTGAYIEVKETHYCSYGERESNG